MSWVCGFWATSLGEDLGDGDGDVEAFTNASRRPGMAG
jgi:hypothetical protein